VHRSLFPPFYVEMLRSAEASGHLDYVLDQLSRYIERDLEARRKIRSALAYPAIILVMSMVTIVILTTFVLPRFRRFFESLDATLPLPTRMLLGATGFFATWWWAIGAFALVFAFFLWRFLKTTRGRRMKDGLALRLPVAGEVVRFAIIERFCRILSSMLRAGVPLPDAMAIVAEGTNNVIYEDALLKAREEMLQGDGLSRPVQRTGLFPSSVTQMVRVGEDTGTLDEQLEAAAGFFDRELDYKIKRLTSLFEPAVIVFMGVVVGFVAIALVSAMYGIFQQAGGV
jgi:type IV pilus assembly protein PilC